MKRKEEEGDDQNTSSYEATKLSKRVVVKNKMLQVEAVAQVITRSEKE